MIENHDFERVPFYGQETLSSKRVIKETFVNKSCQACLVARGFEEDSINLRRLSNL